MRWRSKRLFSAPQLVPSLRHEVIVEAHSPEWKAQLMHKPKAKPTPSGAEWHRVGGRRQGEAMLRARLRPHCGEALFPPKMSPSLWEGHAGAVQIETRSQPRYMSRQGRSRVVGRLSITDIGVGRGRLLALPSLGVPRAPTDGGKTNSASADRAGCEPGLLA